MKTLMRKLVRAYLKTLGNKRDLRRELLGKRQAIRLARLHYQWLHFTPQPCDAETHSEA